MFKLLNLNPNKNQYDALGFYVVLLGINIALLMTMLLLHNPSLRLSLLPIILVTSIKPIAKMKKNKFLNVYL